MLTYGLCDLAVAEEFEGFQCSQFYTEKEWWYIDNIAKWLLLNVFDVNTRNLFISRMWQQPYAMMEAKIDAILNKTEKETDTKYLLYSAHDHQVANLVRWLSPSNTPWNTIAFAASVVMELHYDKDCLATKNDRSCFFTYTFLNGERMSFSPCTAQFADEVEYCNYDVFMRHLNEIKMKGDLDAACYDKFVPLR